MKIKPQYLFMIAAVAIWVVSSIVIAHTDNFQILPYSSITGVILMMIGFGIMSYGGRSDKVQKEGQN